MKQVIHLLFKTAKFVDRLIKNNKTGTEEITN